jgi:hypothetical protein
MLHRLLPLALTSQRDAPDVLGVGEPSQARRMTDTLFPQAMTEAPRIDAGVKDEPRGLRPNRTQLELRPVDLEG